jgi:hypothetical protein
MEIEIAIRKAVAIIRTKPLEAEQILLGALVKLSNENGALPIPDVSKSAIITCVKCGSFVFDAEGKKCSDCGHFAND